MQKTWSQQAHIYLVKWLNKTYYYYRNRLTNVDDERQLVRACSRYPYSYCNFLQCTLV